MGPKTTIERRREGGEGDIYIKKLISFIGF